MIDRSEAGFVLTVVAVVMISLFAPFVLAEPDIDRETAFDFDSERPGEAPSVADETTATVGDRTFESAQEAIDAASPGETVILEGTIDERIVIDTNDLTVRGGSGGAVIDGDGEDSVLRITADGVTVADLWIRNSGYHVDSEDAGVFVDGNMTTLRSLHLTDIAFGIWVDGVDDIEISDSRIDGRHDVFPIVDRGNGIHLWKTDNVSISNNEITEVRDGIYYSWATNVDAVDNVMWNNRYGVHYMFSNDNYLENNTAADNDVGFALMVSSDLELRNNTAVRNTGSSGHGILVKDVEYSEISGNVLVENDNGLYVYNSQDNRIADNLVLRNGVGIHSTAGSIDQTVVGNSFIDNDHSVYMTGRELAVWNTSERGNYWADATPIDLTGDGTSEVRYRPAGLVEQIVTDQPDAAVFTESPAFDVIRLAESSFPVIETPGVVDHHPLTESPHDWRHYADKRY